MLQKFIQRPVLSTVISVLLVLLGTISLMNLPVTQFPDIAPPSVLVTASYPGASAEVVARSVATPLEEAVNGVEGMTYMNSNSNNDGSMTLSVFFKLGTDPDQAAVNVQNRVSKAMSLLPQEVVQAGVSTQKQQNSMIMVVNLYSDVKDYDETFLQNYAKINIIPEIQRVPGVGQATVFGTRDYAMRIWLKPERLTAYRLSPQEVTAAIREQNIEAAPGSFGQSSKEAFEFIIKYKGKLNKQEEYENIIIRADDHGAAIRLKDIARVEFGSLTYSNNTVFNGKPGIGILIVQTAGSNANEIQIAIKDLVDKAEASFPRGVKQYIIYSTKEYLDESIRQVQKTLVEAFILVFLVVFLFLQDFRSTLIPAIAVPVAIVGTFFFMQLFGFTINQLTLFALVLAIGIVVDDAIVVVEAVHTKMTGNRKLGPRGATIQSMQEISGAIISITLVMAAVFIPVGFMQGPAGVFYRQFAFTLAIAILISAVNALTLSPALCALILRDHAADHHGKKSGWWERFKYGFNKGFDGLTNRYTGGIRFLIRRKWIAIGGLAVITIATVLLIRNTATGFIPAEDQGFIVYALSTPPGSSLDQTQKAVDKVNDMVSHIEAVDKYVGVSGLNLLTNSSTPRYAVGFVRLKPYEERGSLESVMQEMNGKFAGLKEASVFTFVLPTVPGFGNVNGAELMLQDRTGGPLERLNATSNAFIGALMQRKEVAFAFTTFNTGNPQYLLDIDEAKSKQLQVPVSEILNTMQAYYGSAYASDFNRFGKFFRVVVQAEAPSRAEPSSFNQIYVKSGTGQMVPLNALASLKKVYGPETVTHNNLFNAVTINAMPKPGYTSGDVIHAVEEVAKDQLPRGFSFEWTGMSKEEKATGGQSQIIFILSLLFVYFLLSAQFESYLIPFAVLLSIPTGILGVYTFINLWGIDNNIYVQVGLIMLIGLLAKNAILIIEFALQRRRAGLSLSESAIEAVKLRLRPILMTSLAFIAGLIPLMFAQGSSAQGNHSISIGAAGGMLTGVLLGLFMVPVLYVIFQHLQEKISSRKEVPAESDVVLQSL